MRDAKKPFVTLKLAETLDGRIAAADGSSKWISNARSRKLAHALRARHDAILVGVGTVIKDNPSLTTRRRWRSKRRVGSRNPVRIILDTYLRTPLDSKVIKTAKRTPAFIVVSTRVSDRKVRAFEKKGVRIFKVPASGGKISLRKTLPLLYKKGIKSILVEGGACVAASFLKEKAVDGVIFVIAPKILGAGLASVGDVGIKNINKTITLKSANVKRLGGDIIYSAFIKK